eukprot:2840396-Amphidinium_carterae.1
MATSPQMNCQALFPTILARVRSDMRHPPLSGVLYMQKRCFDGLLVFPQVLCTLYMCSVAVIAKLLFLQRAKEVDARCVDVSLLA